MKINRAENKIETGLPIPSATSSVDPNLICRTTYAGCTPSLCWITRGERSPRLISGKNLNAQKYLLNYQNKIK